MRHSRHFRLVGALLGFLFLAAACSGSESEVAAPSDLTFLMDDGSTATLTDFEGKPVVVNFFASWCPPCRAELPDFEEVYQAKGDTVAFLGINQDSDQQTWRSFVTGTTITFPTAFADGALFEAFEGIGMPTTVFISADGTVMHTQAGALSRDALESLILEHLS